MSEEPTIIHEELTEEPGFELTVAPDAAVAAEPVSNDSSHELSGVAPTAEEQRATYANWLTEQGVNPIDIPHLTMGPREFDLFRAAPTDFQDSVRWLYGLPQASEGSSRYALVEVEFDEPDSSAVPALVYLDASEFGTVVDYQRVVGNTQRQPPVGAYESLPMFAKPTPRGDVGSSIDESAAEQQKAVFAGWLERRNVNPADVPQLKMSRHEFELFRNYPSDYADYLKDRYGLRAEDQICHRYVWVDAPSENPDQPVGPRLLEVSTKAIERIVLSDQDPDDPTPGQPEGTHNVVDIADDIGEAHAYLEDFAERLMEGVTENPFENQYGEDIGIRAGRLKPGQKDAYIRTENAFSEAVQLTLNDSYYDSVCVVAGQYRDPANGKAGMAQIVNPREVFKIEGENLKHLQAIYQNLYEQADFKVTPAQKLERDVAFNDYLMSYIATQAAHNQSNATTADRVQPGPKVRYRT